MGIRGLSIFYKKETFGLFGDGWLMRMIMEEFANVKYFINPRGVQWIACFLGR